MKPRDSAICFDGCQMNRHEFECKSRSVLKPLEIRYLARRGRLLQQLHFRAAFSHPGAFFEQLYLCRGILRLVAIDRCAYVWPLR
jgi:hypothetical protein